MRSEREKFEEWFKEKYKYSADYFEITKFDESMGFYTANDFYNPDSSNAAWVLRASFDAWQAAKAQAVPEWISVKDQLPSDDIGRVLAWVVEQNSLGKCGFVWNCSHSNGVFSDKFETFQVTHWMPLPDAPQEPAND